jgi:glycosyltransferase involved in cell wall biosynthesis
LKILITVDPEIPVPPKLYGGIERIVFDLCYGLIKSGISVGLVANAESTTNVDRFYHWPGKKSQNMLDTVKNAIYLQNVVHDINPDIIHSFSRLMYLSLLAFTKTPLIMSYQRKPTPKSIQLACRLFGKRIHFTGCSNHICELGRAAGGAWSTIHNFVDISKYEFRPQVELDAPLVFLSRIEEIKGVHLAIEIAKRANKKLIIAGNHSTTPKDKFYWEQRIEQELGQNGIEYIGAVNDKQKNKLLGQALAMIVPIQWDEPFGIVFAESLACGTPVITCPRGAALEILQEGINGFLINSIDQGVESISRLKEINRSKCRDRVEESFNAEVITTKYQNLYLSLI